MKISQKIQNKLVFGDSLKIQGGFLVLICINTQINWHILQKVPHLINYKMWNFVSVVFQYLSKE